MSRTTKAVARPTTLSCGLWPWAELARRHSVDIERVCACAGIEVSNLRQPFARWPQDRCNRIAEFACENFGADAAMAASLTVEAGHFQLLELLVRTAPTVGHGLRIGCWFFRLLHDGGRLEHERSSSGTHVITWVPPDFVVHHGYVELTFGVTMLGIRRETRCENACASEVSFRRPAVPDLSLYERVLGCRPSFDMSEDRLVIDRRVAELRMARRNVDVHAKARSLAQELLGHEEPTSRTESSRA